MDKRDENTERELPDVKDEEIEQETGEELPDRRNRATTPIVTFGGITRPVPGYTAGGYYPDPYASERALFTIDQGNVTQNPLGG